MESTEEKNNKKLSTEIEKSGRNDQHEIGFYELIMEMMIEDYSYCVTEDTVTGMHLAQGKPHHSSQMNV